jgi:HemY protein
MRALLWLLAVFAAAALIAVGGRFNDGYALLVYPPYRIELSLVLFCVLLLGAFAVLYVAFRIAHHIVSLPVHVRVYRERRRKAQAQSALLGAAQALFEGRYARAERDARQAFESGESRSLAALLAARAAHALRMRERRDEWLERAAGDEDPLHVARLVTRAELLLDDRDFAGARTVLRDLHDSGPRHIASLRMLLRAELGARNWEEVLRLSDMLAKRNAISPAMHAEYKAQALAELLGALSQDVQAFETRWRRTPARDQVLPKVAAAAARQAAALGLPALSREIVEKALAGEWNAALVDIYGSTPGDDVRARIERAERWLRERPADARLLLALGSLCVHAELWGKAQNYLEASLAFEAGRDAHLALARLFERLGKEADAGRHYRLAAQL